MSQTLVANLYNPHEQSKEKLIQSFVVRQKVFEFLFQEIRTSDMKQPEPHFLVEGQRGMGKTTLLLRLSYEIENDEDLNKWLIPVILKEEAYYGITRLFKLWETIAQELEEKDRAFWGLSEQMINSYNEKTDYERQCFDLLIQSLKKNKKKIILFIDNIGEMFQNFNHTENYHLCEILVNSSYLRIIGATAIILDSASKDEHVCYMFFKKLQLDGLNKEETRILLQELAKTYHQEETINVIMEKQPGRIETLRILTGGVIRTIVLLFEIFVDQETGNSINDLENILDRVTPLYKHRMDDLTPLQRDIVNAIALNWDAISPEEIAEKTRLKINEVHSILKELENVFIIQKVPTDVQDYYYLKERFFNIWYLMRLASKGNQAKVIWLVRFLESWYDKAELIQRAEKHIQVLTTRGNYHPKAAYCLTEALAGTGKLDMVTEHVMKVVTKILLLKKDRSLAADLSQSDKELLEQGDRYYQNKDYHNALNTFLKIKNKNERINFKIGVSLSLLNHPEKALDYLLKVAEKGNENALYNLGLIYQKELNDFHNAEKYLLMAAEKGHVRAMSNLGELYKNELKNYQEAGKYLLMAAKKGYAEAMRELALLYFEQKIKKTEALQYAYQAVKRDKNIENQYPLACMCVWNQKYEEAVQIAKEFMYDKKSYEMIEEGILLYMMLLLAKKQYHYVSEYSELPDLNLKDRLKPLYYAFLYFTDNKKFQKLPPELNEPVNGIIKQIMQMAEDYV